MEENLNEFYHYLMNKYAIDFDDEEIKDVTKAVTSCVKTFPEMFNKSSRFLRINRIVPCGSTAENTTVWVNKHNYSEWVEEMNEDSNEVLDSLKDIPPDSRFMEFDFLAVLDPVADDMETIATCQGYAKIKSQKLLDQWRRKVSSFSSKYEYIQLPAEEQFSAEGVNIITADSEDEFKPSAPAAIKPVNFMLTPMEDLKKLTCRDKEIEDLIEISVEGDATVTVDFTKFHSRPEDKSTNRETFTTINQSAGLSEQKRSTQFDSSPCFTSTSTTPELENEDISSDEDNFPVYFQDDRPVELDSWNLYDVDYLRCRPFEFVLEEYELYVRYVSEHVLADMNKAGSAGKLYLVCKITDAKFLLKWIGKDTDRSRPVMYIKVDFLPAFETTHLKDVKTSFIVGKTCKQNCCQENECENQCWRVSHCLEEIRTIKDMSQCHRDVYKTIKVFNDKLSKYLFYVALFSDEGHHQFDKIPFKSYHVKLVLLQHIIGGCQNSTSVHRCLCQIMKELLQCARKAHIPHWRENMELEIHEVFREPYELFYQVIKQLGSGLSIEQCFTGNDSHSMVYMADGIYDLVQQDAHGEFEKVVDFTAFNFAWDLRNKHLSVQSEPTGYISDSDFNISDVRETRKQKRTGARDSSTRNWNTKFNYCERLHMSTKPTRCHSDGDVRFISVFVEKNIECIPKESEIFCETIATAAQHASKYTGNLVRQRKRQRKVKRNRVAEDIDGINTVEKGIFKGGSQLYSSLIVELRKFNINFKQFDRMLQQKRAKYLHGFGYMDLKNRFWTQTPSEPDAEHSDTELDTTEIYGYENGKNVKIRPATGHAGFMISGSRGSHKLLRRSSEGDLEITKTFLKERDILSPVIHGPLKDQMRCTQVPKFKYKIHKIRPKALEKSNLTRKRNFELILYLMEK